MVRLSLLTFAVDEGGVCPCQVEGPDHVLVAVEGRDVKGRLSLAVGSVHLGPGLDEQPGQVVVLLPGRQVEHRVLFWGGVTFYANGVGLRVFFYRSYLEGFLDELDLALGLVGEKFAADVDVARVNRRKQWDVTILEKRGGPSPSIMHQ